MTLNDHLSNNPKLGFIAWLICSIPGTITELLGKYHDVKLPEWFMQLGQIGFWCIGGCVGLITIFEWLKNNVPYLKRKFKKR